MCDAQAPLGSLEGKNTIQQCQGFATIFQTARAAMMDNDSNGDQVVDARRSFLLSQPLSSEGGSRTLTR